MRIPFDIKYRQQIESGEYKVETYDGYPARIICWDSPIDKDRPIIAIVFDNQIEQYKADGRYDNDFDTSNYDLFIVTQEPEMSEFEKAVSKYRPQSDTLETIQRIAAELLSLARNEFNKQIENDYREIIYGADKRCKADTEQEVERRIQSGELLTQEHHEKLMETQYKETLEGVKKNWHDYFTPQAVTDIYNAGRNDVLKDLPRWKIWSNGACGNSDGYPIALVHRGCGFNLVSTLGIDGEKYIMLSDIKKLPGFKEEDHE